MPINLEMLRSLSDRIATERQQAIDDMLTAMPSSGLQPDRLSRLGQLQLAWLAVSAEIERHTPHLGSGAES